MRIAVPVLALALTGCALLDLRDDLREIDRLATVSGSIAGAGDTGAPVVLAIMRDKLAREALVDARVTDPAGFEARLPAGTYYVAAFEDLNRDFAYQPEEPAGAYPAPLVLGEGELRDGIDIALVTGNPLAAEEPGPRGERPLLWAGRRNIGAVLPLDDPRFAPDVARTGLWQPLRFSLEYGPGLFLLAPHDPARVPVLLVHGIGGTPRDFETVIAALDGTRFEPWLLAYASGLPLETNARYMAEAVTQLRLQLGVPRVLVVAHSMGGLVARQALAGLADPPPAFVTLATPWAGHAAAEFGVENAPVVAPVWRDMAPSSAFLASLRETPLPEATAHTLLFAFGGSARLGGAATDGVITVASQLEPSTQAGATLVRGFDATHVGILSDPGAIRTLMAALTAAD